MRKSIFLVVLTLGLGMTTQHTLANHQDVTYNPGNFDRYYNAQVIRFVENGVMYSVRMDGTFRFREMHRPYQYTYGRRNHQVSNYPAAPGGIDPRVNRRGYRHLIKTDRFGRIRSIGNTFITYKRNGKVRSIGGVNMFYQRGRLIQVGNMQILYNRRGKIRRVIGHVNRYNRKVWHRDWYRYNNDWDGDDFGDDFDDDWFDNDDDFPFDRQRNKKNE